MLQCENPLNPSFKEALNWKQPLLSLKKNSTHTQFNHRNPMLNHGNSCHIQFLKQNYERRIVYHIGLD